MKHAILITAYKNPAQLLELINYFPDDFEFFIHIDKKSNFNVSELTNVHNKKIFVTQKYTVNWGGINHLRAILFLAAEALKNKSLGFFHLITGEDYPVKPVDYFVQSLDTKYSYLDSWKLTKDTWRDRIDYYNLYDTFNAKDPKWLHRILRLVNLQKKMKIKRSYSKDFPPLFGGSTYWSMTRQSVQYVLDYTNRDHRLLDRLKYTFCAEELYFQTILMNFADQNVINDNLRYLEWDSGRAVFLDARHFPKIITSNKLFARKFHYQDSQELKRMVNDHNLLKTNIE